MKFLYLLLLVASISIFAAPKTTTEALDAPTIVQDEVPNLAVKIISINKASKTIKVSLENKEVTVGITSKTYIQYIGRKTIKQMKFSKIPTGITISVNSSSLFNDLQRKQLNEKKVYNADTLILTAQQ